MRPNLARTWTLFLCGLATVAGCATKPTPPLPTTGTIRGVVKYVGKKPEPRRLDMSADPFCAACWAGQGGGPINDVWGENDTLQNVLVYISDGLGDRKFAAPKEPVYITAAGCRYVPHVAVAQTGQLVIMRNTDATLHNYHVIPTEQHVNLAMCAAQPGVGVNQEFKAARPELGIYIKCDVHAWMNAYLHVLSHPYYSVTREAGTFEIRDVPSGEYELSAWHEFKAFQLDEEELRVMVVPGQATEVTFTVRAHDRE